ncbi:hypothetical protein V6N13_142804 [Hibiscus sabdariffa]|uniref:Uncharacterized protein n=1 Tax=Hibiscus sabdariffa TaxID=183260 RepID=A0ABR2FFD3_9ROSI
MALASVSSGPLSPAGPENVAPRPSSSLRASPTPAEPSFAVPLTLNFSYTVGGFQAAFASSPFEKLRFVGVEYFFSNTMSLRASYSDQQAADELDNEPDTFGNTCPLDIHALYVIIIQVVYWYPMQTPPLKIERPEFGYGRAIGKINDTAIAPRAKMSFTLGRYMKSSYHTTKMQSAFL